LDMEPELWDPANKRFTLFFDPGRVKRGLKPREEAGPTLEAGKKYTLVIDKDWTDAAGNSLRESYRKPIEAGPPDDNAIDPKTWKLAVPKAGSREPLAITFPKPLDHALLQRMLWMVGANERRLNGTIEVTNEETRWLFKPEKPWQ